LCCKNLTKTRDWFGRTLKVVAAPFSRFFITNTLHHRLLAYVLCLLQKWCVVEQLWRSEVFSRHGGALSANAITTKKVAAPAI
jgi:hypothetical protein